MAEKVTFSVERNARVTLERAMEAITRAVHGADETVIVRLLPQRPALRGVRFVTVSTEKKKLGKVVQAMRTAPGIKEVMQMPSVPPVHATLTR